MQTLQPEGLNPIFVVIDEYRFALFCFPIEKGVKENGKLFFGGGGVWRGTFKENSPHSYLCGVWAEDS